LLILVRRVLDRCSDFFSLHVFSIAQAWDGIYVLEGTTTINAQVTIDGAEVSFLGNATINDQLYVARNSSVACVPLLSYQPVLFHMLFVHALV